MQDAERIRLLQKRMVSKGGHYTLKKRVNDGLDNDTCTKNGTH